MDTIKFDPSVFMSDLSAFVRHGELQWRIEHILQYYWKGQCPLDSHFVYCADGLSWRFKQLAEKIDNMDRSRISSENLGCPGYIEMEKGRIKITEFILNGGRS